MFQKKILGFKIILFVILIFSNCRERPEKDYSMLLNAISKRNEEETKKFLNKKSIDLLQNIEFIQDKTKKKLKSVVNFQSFIPSGKIIEVERKKDVSLLTIDNKGKEEKIILLKEDGRWKIDITLLSQFYKQFLETE